MTLAKSGYYGSSPTAIWNAPVDDVMCAFHYENFTADYQEEYYELNREK